MSTIPSDRKYSETHEWFLTTGDEVTIGITQFAADQLSDVTFVDLPEVGRQTGVGSTLAEIESVKATSELFSAVGGEVSAVNTKLIDIPELVNNDPYNDGWMVKLKATDLGPLDRLMEAAAYEEMLEQAG